MIGFVVIAVVVLVLFGAAVGFMAVVSLAGWLDKDVTVPPQTRLARAGRAAGGMHRRPEPIREAVAYRRQPHQHDQGPW
jgi:hypothetical protein